MLAVTIRETLFPSLYVGGAGMWEGLVYGRSLYMGVYRTLSSLELRLWKWSLQSRVTGTGRGLRHTSTVAVDYFNAGYISTEIVQMTESVF